MINRPNKFFIKYPYIPIIVVSSGFNNVLADPERLDTPGSIGCLYVFYRVYKQWILNRKILGMIYKLPFYTACIDLLINISFFINIMHTVTNAQVWYEPICKTMSILNWAFITINLSFYSVIALMTYLRICHEKYCDCGRYEWKVWIIVFATSLILQLMNFPNHGARKYWCAGRTGQVRSPLILFAVITVSLLIICFCYMSIYLKIINVQNRPITTLSKDSDNENGIGNEVLEQRAEIERRAAKKIMSYVLVFIIQWVPLQISGAARFFLNDDTWVYMIASIGRSFGGIGNAIQYIINEGWVTIESTEYDTTRSQETDNKSTSLNDNYKLIELNNNEIMSPKNTESTENKTSIINIEDNNQA
ncbi:hypothetical protein GLOIN_2v1717715 [Rhizophagus clarus]|uniref:G-protein coupled receptors family 1 profile domain-containing protein n=1 Tax=Rhizophagus clarus TaxID=94130 RepID=A0A8H3QZ74_9GLOM|nr:hypothetical protein GLOIN_2v1717715 [Rhizophagus clarus]